MFDLDPVSLYFVGTAGSGKTTITAAFQQWLNLQGLDSVIMNLDPGAEGLPYGADYDVREWLTLHKVMEEYNLGPNGAQVAAADLLALRVQEIRDIMDTFRSPYILVDTPGQLELFCFRKSSKLIMDTLSGDRGMIVFLLDPTIAKVPSGYISQMMLSATVQFRFPLPMVNVLSKSDLLSESELETIREWARDPYKLQVAADEEMKSPQTQFNLELFRAIENTGAFSNFWAVSSETMTGLEDIYNSVQQQFSGGEDLSKD